MKIYLIRHGQTDWNIQGMIQGSHDIPLNETGRRQAELLAEAMDMKPVKRVISSTLSRAAETASLIGERQKVEVYFMDSLIEVEFGEWEGLTWEEITERYPKEMELWNLNPAEVAPPGGENLMDVLRRCIASLKTIMDMTGGREDIAVVSHGATLAHLISYMLKEDQDTEDIIVENASITTVSYNPLTEDFMLLSANDTRHLEYMTPHLP